MISVLFGVAGSGKSMLQVKLIYDELINSRRNIVTNMALLLGELQDYIMRSRPDAKVDVAERVLVLTREQTATFWEYRGPIKRTGPDVYDFGYDAGLHGVLYVIDEAGASGFDNRGWLEEIAGAGGKRTKRGIEAVWYLDQHRKLGDDVIASANGRVPTTIAKPFRDKAEQFVRLRNGYTTTYGPFKAPPRFTATYFYSEPSKTVDPFKTEKFLLDVKGLAACYNTASGMGILGTNADKGKKAKGLPLWTLWPMAGALASLAIIVPMLVNFGLRYVHGHKHSAPTSEVKQLNSSTSVQSKASSKSSAIQTTTKGSMLEYNGLMRTSHGVAVCLPDEGWVHVMGITNTGFAVLDDGRLAKRAKPVKTGTSEPVASLGISSYRANGS